MRTRLVAVVGVLLVATAAGYGKAKSQLPGYVLEAKTVAVMIDPEAGMSAQDPQANRNAQRDVEAALQGWGRFTQAIDIHKADLIVVVRRGSDRLVNETISDPRQNNRPGTATASDNAVMIGGQRGQQPDMSRDQLPGQQPVHPQTEIGQTDDMFTVFRGDVKDPLEAAPVWRYVAKDGLRSHNVPAVGEFKKAVADAEKAAAKKP